MSATETQEITTDNIIDVREVIARVEALRDENEDATQELGTLEALLAELAGNGGDEKWEGDWYPITLVRDSYFENHAREIAEDCGMINKDAQWPNNCIDWERASRELQMDYTSCEFDGVTYWYR